MNLNETLNILKNRFSYEWQLSCSGSSRLYIKRLISIDGKKNVM